jgi:hypothetical protein
MDPRKNKVFLAAIVIVGAIIIVVFVLNKFNVVQKFENFVDDEGEEGYEENNDEESENDDQETFTEKGLVKPQTTPTPTPSPTTPQKTEQKPTSPSTSTNTEDTSKDVKPLNDISAKFRKLIDEMDKQLKNKAVSDEIKKKVMTDLMGSNESFTKLGDDTSSLITSIIQKYIPKQEKDHFSEPLLKSTTIIKKHLQDALQEIERMESGNNTVAPKSTVNERFVQSRDVPVSKHTPPSANEDVIEGFENTPHYALY